MENVLLSLWEPCSRYVPLYVLGVVLLGPGGPVWFVLMCKGWPGDLWTNLTSLLPFHPCTPTHTHHTPPNTRRVFTAQTSDQLLQHASWTKYFYGAKVGLSKPLPRKMVK